MAIEADHDRNLTLPGIRLEPSSAEIRELVRLRLRDWDWYQVLREARRRARRERWARLREELRRIDE